MPKRSVECGASAWIRKRNQKLEQIVVDLDLSRVSRRSSKKAQKRSLTKTSSIVMRI